MSHHWFTNFPRLHSHLSMLQKEIHSVCGQRWSIYRLYCAMRQGRTGQLVSADTDVVIEGYGSSANTFAVAAFQFSQTMPVQIAHHAHVPSQVNKAVSLGIPTILLIRNPVSLVPSAVSGLYPSQSLYGWKTLHLRQAVTQVLKHYLRFYALVLPNLDGVVIGRFDEVTSNYGNVVRRLNERFGTEYIPFSDGEEDVRACMQLVGRRKPTSDRDDLKQVVSDELHSASHSVLLSRALELYEEITQK